MTRGWCPTLFEPMVAADGLLATVKPRVQGWSAVALRKIAQAAAAHGSGKLLVTNRGNLQVRGLSRASAGAFASVMLRLGVSSADQQAERRRNILMLPAQSDESEAFGGRLESWLESEVTLAGLPAKFSFTVTSGPCGSDCGGADLCIHIRGRKAWVALRAGGSRPESYGVCTDEPLAAVASIAQAFMRLARASRGAYRRLRDLTADRGTAAVLSVARLAPSQWSRAPKEFAARASDGSVSCVGPLVGQRFGLSAPFGRADTSMLIAVADLAERFGAGRLRLTAQRTLILFGTTVDVQAELSERATQAGFIVNSGDSRLRVAACFGGSGCARTAVDVHAAAASLAPWWRGEGVLHVAGCPKGCAHPGTAAVTVVAGPFDGHFHVLRDARADALKSRTLSLEHVRQLLTSVGSEKPA